MELTKRDIEIAERYISKREKQLAQWPLRRWLILAIYSVFILIGYRSISDGVRSINDDKATDADVRRAVGEAPPPGLEQRWAVGTMLKIARIVEDRHQVVSYSLMEIALGYVFILSGAAMLCITFLRWNTGERDALICKVLRAKLQELEQVAAPNGRRAGQLPASPEVQPSDSQRTSSSGGGA